MQASQTAQRDGRPYVVISADTHAGASIEGYRDYLDEEHRALFDDWRGSYRNPQRSHIGSKKHKNWDDAERLRDMEGDGVVGEIIFPNTVPPFFKTSVLICGNPSVENYPRRLIGIRAHNRWLADWCAEHPERRAGIGLVYLNDVDEAIKDVEWISEHGLRGGVLLPHVPPDCTHIKPLYAPDYDRFWAVCQDRGVIVNQHGGTGSPDYGPYKVALPIRLLETSWFSTRSYAHLLLAGVFERFPRLRYILTESGCAWAPGLMKQLDAMFLAWKAGAIGEIDTTRDPALREKPSFYARRNCWYGASFPGPRDIEGRDAVGVDKILWGNDYPHYEGCFPYSRENMRFALAAVDPQEVRMMLGENAAKLYGFDLEALRPAAEAAGITPKLVATPLDEIPADSTCITFQRARFERARAAAR
jgi:predicted TIM-barrel fold metal-dependent hydrolase